MDNNQIRLLEDLYWFCRGILRYNGIDKERADEYFEDMKTTVYKLNDLDQNIGINNESE